MFCPQHSLHYVASPFCRPAAKQISFACLPAASIPRPCLAPCVVPSMTHLLPIAATCPTTGDYTDYVAVGLVSALLRYLVGSSREPCLPSRPTRTHCALPQRALATTPPLPCPASCPDSPALSEQPLGSSALLSHGPAVPDCLPRTRSTLLLEPSPASTPCPLDKSDQYRQDLPPCTEPRRTIRTTTEEMRIARIRFSKLISLYYIQRRILPSDVASQSYLSAAAMLREPHSCTTTSHLTL